MDLNLILRWLVIISCVSLMVRVFLSRRNWGWLVTAILILGIIITTFFSIPEQSGIIGGILWLIFVLVPILGLRLVNHWIYKEQFSKAHWLASFLSWLHPADGWREQPQFLQILQLIKKGKPETAQSLLAQSFKTNHHHFYETAKAIQYRMEARWEDSLYWLKHEVSDPTIWENSTLATLYLRSIAESNDLNGLIFTTHSHHNQLELLGDNIPINIARLYVFAFSGQVKTVEKILRSTLRFYSKNLKQFWLATAQMSAGYEEKAQKLLLNIQHKDISLENAIAYRLAHPLTSAQQILSAESLGIITSIEEKLNQEINYGGAINLTPTKAEATYTIVIINLFVFALEIAQGGSENLETLYRLGAAVPNAVKDGEIWRIVTANFLHFGWIHLVSNLIGLWIISPYVEFYLGIIRYLWVYFFSGIGAISLFIGIALVTGRGEDLLVGASAAIMGLMGATFVILWRGWRQEKAKIAQEKLQLVVMIIGLQVMFDFSMSNVSFLGHFFGLLLGILSTAIILSLTKNHEQRTN